MKAVLCGTLPSPPAPALSLGPRAAGPRAGPPPARPPLDIEALVARLRHAHLAAALARLAPPSYSAAGSGGGGGGGGLNRSVFTAKVVTKTAEHVEGRRRAEGRLLLVISNHQVGDSNGRA